MILQKIMIYELANVWKVIRFWAYLWIISTCKDWLYCFKFTTVNSKYCVQRSRSTLSVLLNLFSDERTNINYFGKEKVSRPKKNQTFSRNHFFTLCGLSSIITFTFESEKGKKKKEKLKKLLSVKPFLFRLPEHFIWMSKKD